MKNSKKRVTIYATYNPKGIVDDYIIYFAKKLRQVSDKIIVVSNNKYKKDEKEKIASIVDCVYERDNAGYDVGALAYGINRLINENELELTDELILLNDSIFGPIYDLDGMFEEMEKKNPKVDFWGITKRGISKFDGGDTVYPEHLQTYFYVIRNKMLHSADFAEYWGNIVEKVTDFRSAILNYEFAFTKYFEDRGYLSGCYCDCSEYITENPDMNLSPYHYEMFDLVSNKKCPFIKRKLFTGDFVENTYSDTLDLKRTMEYVENHTEYDVEVIWKYILQNYPMSQIIKTLHMTECIKSDIGDELYKDEISQVLLSGGVYNRVIYDKYAVFVYFPMKIEPKTLWKAHVDNICENLLANADYLSKVIDLFEQDSKLGVVVPPVNTYGKIRTSVNLQWADLEIFSAMREKYKLNVLVSCKEASIHKIYGFICRKEILNDEIIRDIVEDKSGTMFQMMPLFAQERNYYTKIVSNSSYMSSIVDNLFCILRTIFEQNASYQDKEDKSLGEIENDIIENKIRIFSQENSEVYVYGAGQLAYRAIDKAQKYMNIKSVIVSDTNGNPKSVYGYPVIRFDSVDSIQETGVIVAVGKKNNDLIIDKLKRSNVKNILVLS